MYQEFIVGEGGIPPNTCAGCGKPTAMGKPVMAISRSQAKAGQLFHPGHQPGPAVEDGSDLSEMSAKALKAEAKARGLKGYSKLSKPDLVALLEG